MIICPTKPLLDSRLASCHLRTFIVFYRFYGFPSMSLCNGKVGPAAPIETFARFQAGFLSSEDFHRFLLIIIDFMDFYRFSYIFIDFH